MGQDLDDLIQEGVIGLMAAAKKFNPETGFRFSTFAGRCIENNIRQYIQGQRRHKRCTMSLDQEVGEDGCPPWRCLRRVAERNRGSLETGIPGEGGIGFG